MSRTISRRFLCRSILLGGIAFAAGCGPKNNQTSGNGSSSPNTPSGGKKIRAAMVLDTGGVDDRSFNAAAWAGMQRAEKELGVEIKMIESKDAADYKPNLMQFASDGYDIIFAVGYKLEAPMKETAALFPNLKFAVVDGNAPADSTNCAALQFREEQSSYLAGFLAGSVSKTKTIGFVGGEEIPLIKKFEAGYRAGAKTASPDIHVIATYTGDWNSIDKGKSQAQQQFSNGADIIMQAAGKAGRGVIKAAEEKGAGFYAIGVDMDQDGEAPGRVLTSVLKRLDNAVFDTVKRVQDNKFQSGTQIYDLKSGGVGITELKFTKQDVSPEALEKLGRLTTLVAKEEVSPPTTLEAVASFVPPKL